MKNRRIKRTADPGLEPTVDVSERQRPWRRRTGRIHGTIELHHPGSERPGFVGAQHVDAAEVLNGREMFDDDLALP